MCFKQGYFWPVYENGLQYFLDHFFFFFKVKKNKNKIRPNYKLTLINALFRGPFFDKSPNRVLQHTTRVHSCKGRLRFFVAPRPCFGILYVFFLFLFFFFLSYKCTMKRSTFKKQCFQFHIDVFGLCPGAHRAVRLRRTGDVIISCRYWF